MDGFWKQKIHSFRKTEYNQGNYVEQQTPANNGDHAKPNREMSKSPALQTKSFLLFQISKLYSKNKNSLTSCKHGAHGFGCVRERRKVRQNFHPT